MMAREVAVDVASHSPQVDPILDELAEVLAELKPKTPEVPYYSATLFDPRESAGVRCPLLGGQPAPHGAILRRGAGRIGGRASGSSPSCHRTRCLPTLSSRPPAAWTCLLAALAGMRREQELPNGLRGFLADLHSAGAAIDFSVLYPAGQLVDAPLPTWTHRRAAA